MSAAAGAAARHEPNIALVRALSQLARRASDELQADAKLRADLEEAAGRWQQELRERGIASRAGRPPGATVAELQQELLGLQKQLAAVDLERSCESEWQFLWEQRNAVREELIIVLGTAQARLQKKLQLLDATLTDWPTQKAFAGLSHSCEEKAHDAAKLAATSASAVTTHFNAKATDLNTMIDEMASCSAEARLTAAELVSQLVGSDDQRHTQKAQERDECAEELCRVRRQLYPIWDAHERWRQGRSLLDSLAKVHAEFKEAKLAERTARRRYEDLMGSSDEEGGEEPEPDVVRARQKSVAMRDKMEELLRLREATQSQIQEVATAPHTAGPGGAGGVCRRLCYIEGGDTALQLDLPELPVLAHRVVVPFKPPADALQMSPRDTECRHVERMLRRDGLLVDRSYENFSEDNLPEWMHAATLGKIHVKAARLRGAEAEGQPALKILKAFPIDQYQRIKRAVLTAHRLQHPGVVPVECAFLDKKKHVVVTQSRFYEGGNMRAWAPGKSMLARLVAAQRIAAAIAELHQMDILHRDIKPENVVFSGSGDDAWPALCDFDLSLDMRETTSSTVMRGTLLYMAPELKPSPKSDVFSFGTTLLDMLVCDSNQDRLPRKDSLLGPTLDVGSICSVLDISDPVHALIAEMLSENAAARPTASEVSRRLDTLAAVAAAKDCVVCQDSFAPEQGLSCCGSEGEAARESHFVCHECLSQDIIARQVGRINIDDLSADFIRCCCWSPGAPPGCDSRAFPMQVIAQHCTADAFAAIGQRIDDLRRAEMERYFDEKRKLLEQELIHKSKTELEVLAARRHIEDAIMVLRCPKCKLAFLDYDGCAALTCHSCSCGFCALCQTDCGTDAHR